MEDSKAAVIFKKAGDEWVPQSFLLASPSSFAGNLKTHKEWLGDARLFILSDTPYHLANIYSPCTLDQLLECGAEEVVISE